jgi:ubiquinone/menaquinone biosynthesis C-methylase UbiE
MKMGRFEKWFINAAGHSRQVAQAAERRLPIVPFGSTLKYLDVGCGNGMTAMHLASTYRFDVTGIDVDPEQIRLARQSAGNRSDVRFLVADATRLPFDSEEFDVVATNKTTHHIPDWKSALAEMIRVLRPGGHFIYGDLVVPPWLARIGQSTLGSFAGLVTRSELEGFIRRHDLTIVQQASCFASYEGVWRRPAA